MCLKDSLGYPLQNTGQHMKKMKNKPGDIQSNHHGCIFCNINLNYGLYGHDGILEIFGDHTAEYCG